MEECEIVFFLQLVGYGRCIFSYCFRSWFNA